VDFTREESLLAYRMYQEAEHRHEEAQKILRREQAKLGVLEKNATFAEKSIGIADIFDTNNTRLILIDEMDCKSYTTHTTTGKPVRFAVKHLMYPLALDATSIVGLAKPVVGSCLTTNSYRGYANAMIHPVMSTIQQTDLFEILSSVSILTYSSRLPLFPVDSLKP
jgi:hypothetical protein